MDDILFEYNNCIFSYRVGGILIHKDKVLMQSVVGEDGYAIVGGHVAFGETTEETLKREFKEELCADINIDKLAAVGENFFLWNDRPCQQVNLYYIVSLKDETQIPTDGIFTALDELGSERIGLNMCWISLENINSITVYPPQIKDIILQQNNSVKHFVYNELI